MLFLITNQSNCFTLFVLKLRGDTSLNFSYQFGGKPIFERSVKIVDSRLNEPLEFSEICNGRSVFFSVLVRYTVLSH